MRRPLQRKQRKHRTFLTLFLYTILKYLFIKILCFRCSWSINGVIKPFVAAQKLHKTCTKPAQNCTELPPAAATPLHLYPESPQKLHPNVQLNAPAPRINSRIFLLVKAKGNNKDRFAHHLKVANRSFSVAETSPARCVSEREKGENLAPGDSKGRSPWRAFGDFPRDGKVTRGWRGGAPSPWGSWGRSPHLGGVQRRALALLASVGAGATSPCKTSPGTCKKPPPMVS